MYGLESIWEVFQSYCDIQQTSPVESIGDLCSLLNETFPSSQMELTSPLCDVIAPIKRVSYPSISGKGKVIKLQELNDSTVTPLDVIDSRMNADSGVPISIQNVYLME